MSSNNARSLARALARRPVRAIAARISARLGADLGARLDDVAARVRSDTLVTSEFYILMDRRLQMIEERLDALHHQGLDAATVEAARARLIEAYALQHSATLPADARILVTGPDASRLASALASSGYNVTALGFVPRTARAATVTVVAEAIDSWSGPAHRFHLIVCVGAQPGATGVEPALDRLRTWLAPEGFLLLATQADGDAHGTAPRSQLDGWHIEEAHDFAVLLATAPR